MYCGGEEEEVGSPLAIETPPEWLAEYGRAGTGELPFA